MPAPITKSPWLLLPRPNPNAAVRLFCFPYAAGSAVMFRDWPAHLPATVEVCGIQPPGRGSRLTETPYTNLTLLVQSVVQAIQPYCDKPFAIFGHSMGAKLGFEFARRMRNVHGIEPAHLFLSGCRAPQFPDPEPFYDLPQPEFMEKLRGLNGTPAEVLDHPELMELLLPLLRADFEVIQTHTYSEEPPLDCPLTAFGGLQDEDISREQLKGWREQTTSQFSLQMFSGDHFFVRSSQSLLLQAISEGLRQSLDCME
jgi:medium-chain acyl-[acyl-carrier-protein] hydrolase